MTRERFAKQFGIDPEKLAYQMGKNKMFDFAIVGDFCIYREGNDYYCVDSDNQVCQWRHDLTRYM